jgi:hypothetical protein
MMADMPATDWTQVLANEYQVPDDRPLPELTAELTTMLGDPDPEARDGVAFPVLATWVSDGVYDDLLVGLGDGMATGLATGLGENGTDSVFRRTFSALVLGCVIERDTEERLVPTEQVLRWGDKIVGWYLRENDLRGFVPGRGWAHAVAHGADAIGALAASPHLTVSELSVLLDVIADRALSATEPLLCGEPDRMASAVLEIFRRNLVPVSDVEPWLARLEESANPFGRTDAAELDPFAATTNPQALLRAVYLQLAFGSQPPADRADLMLVTVDALRRTNPFTLKP